jgi:hypothetical protein
MLDALRSRLDRQSVAPYTPRHRGPYDLTVDIVRKNSTVVPARHSLDPESLRAVFPR